MAKVIYVSDVPLTPKLDQCLFIGGLIENGTDVEFWCLRDIFFKGFRFKNVLAKDFVQDISSYCQLADLLKKTDRKNTFFILQVHLQWHTLWLYGIFTWFRCHIAFFDVFTWGHKPLASRFVEKLKRKDNRSSFYKGGLNVLARSLRKCNIIKKYDLLFLVGERTADSLAKASKIVSINYHDYEKYRKSSDKKDRLVVEEYCVFLDHGAIKNEDPKILGDLQIDPDKYYTALEPFFQGIEKRYGWKVVIAAHPGLSYDQNDFCGRQVFTEKTCDLVRDCRCVITHFTLAVSFAVLFKKPLVFVYTSEYEKKRKENMRAMDDAAQQLGIRTLNIDLASADDVPAMPLVNDQQYDAYKYRFLTSPTSEGRSSAAIVMQALRENHLPK